MTQLPVENPRKTALRKSLLARRKALPPEEARERSEAAQALVLADPAWRAARSVALYHAVRGELDTRTLRTAALAEGKQLLLPRTVPEEKGTMRLLPCADETTLLPGMFGIMEPDPAACPPEPQGGWLPDLLVVPALAYDLKGFRLGMGGGYYDRLLARPAMRGAKRLGLVYSFQLLDALPVEAWDLPVHGVCTEKELLWLS